MENTGYVCLVLALVLCLYAVTTSPMSPRTAITSRRHNRALRRGPQSALALCTDAHSSAHPLSEYVGVIVPYAFSMAALLYRRKDRAWLQTARRWSNAPRSSPPTFSRYLPAGFSDSRWSSNRIAGRAALLVG